MRNRLTLTARLTALYIAVSAVVLIGVGALLSMGVNRHFVEMDQAYLQDKAALVQKIVNEADSLQMLGVRMDGLLASHPGLFVELTAAGRSVYGTDSSAFSQPRFSERVGSDPVDWKVGNRPLRGQMFAIVAPAALANSLSTTKEIDLKIAIDTIHHSHFIHSLQQALVIYLLAALLLSGLLGYWAAHRGLKPLRVMKERAKAVTVQSLEQRMPVDEVPFEFADLAQGLNTMLDRLQADFVRLQDFSSDLAHELRTPINNLLTQTQVSLTKARDVSEYQDVLASNAEEFQRLARMVSDMLLLAKTEHGIALPKPELISLSDEIRDLFDFYEALAEEKRLKLALEGDARIVCDRLMVRRAVSNLLSNAIRYSHNESEVHVSVLRGDAQVELCVQNTGSEIGANDLPRLFDRFYRAEKSRNNPDAEGTGLGLSITKAIMQAHGGSATVKSSGERTSFCLNFPRAPKN